MATTNWTGNVDGDLNNASNWDNGVPASGDTAVFDLANYTGDQVNPSYGTCDAGIVTAGYYISGGTYSGTVTNTGEVFGATFNGAVINESYLNATCNSTVTNNSYIESGTFNGTVTNNATISGGTFNGTVTNNAFINAGTFNGTVTTTGTIYTGTFNGLLDASGVGWLNAYGESRLGGIFNFGIILPYNTKALYYQRGINGSSILGLI